MNNLKKIFIIAAMMAIYIQAVDPKGLGLNRLTVEERDWLARYIALSQQPSVVESDFDLPEHRGWYVDRADGTSVWVSVNNRGRNEVPGITSDSLSQPSMLNTDHIIPLARSERTPREEFYTLTQSLPESMREHARKHFEQNDSLTEVTLEQARALAQMYLAQNQE